jgi:hypothetical protein
MIPKVIHYCWFGSAPMPKLALKCIDSWKKILPDYELKLWNETNFDIQSVPYTKEAYYARKYAFVTDYVRLYALFHFGGIYMDTDVEVLKSLDDLLYLPGFSGFESETEVPTGIMACEQHNVWSKEQLDEYNGKHFITVDEKLDMTSNVQIISASMASNGFRLQNSYQVYKNCMHLFPKEYFCPKSRTGILTLTSNTYCIHHFAASWDTPQLKLKRWFFRKLLGPKITDFLVRSKKQILKQP